MGICLGVYWVSKEKMNWGVLSGHEVQGRDFVTNYRGSNLIQFMGYRWVMGQNKLILTADRTTFYLRKLFNVPDRARIETLSICAHLKGIDNTFQMAYYMWH